MSISRHIACQDCGGSFWHRVERRSDPNPDECPLCHNTGEPVLDMKGKLHPNIAKMVDEGRGPATTMTKAKSGDAVYRGMENASAARAQLAADDLGVDVSEMAHMKITDLKDNLRAGDVAAKIPTAPATLTSGPNMATFHQKPETSTGQVMGPGSMGGFGERTRQKVTAGHAQRAHQLVKAGEAGRYVAPRA